MKQSPTDTLTCASDCISASPRHRLRRAVTLAVALVAMAGLPVIAASHDIRIVDNGYEPATLTVLTGEPVTWTNTGNRTHTVTSDGGSELDSGNLAPGEAYGHVFDQPGTYAYHCEIHGAAMSGVIIVEAAPVVSGGQQTPTPVAGTLPPNFSPNAPASPAASGLPAAVSPSPAATPAPSSQEGSSTDPLLLAGAALIALVAVGWFAWYVRGRGR